MKGDSKNKKTIKTIQGTFVNVSDVFSTFWIRLPLQINNGSNWILLGSRCRFLWTFRFFLAFIYTIIKTIT